jgi:biopolymer transport protein ExbB/TolQ
MDKLQDMITGLRGLFNNAPDLVGTIQKAISDNADLKKQVENIMHERAAELKKEILSKQTEVNGFKVLKAITPLGPEFVKDIAFQLRAEVENSIIVIGSVAGGKLESGLSWIGLCISLAPMFGFMGTVIGMIQAFDDIAAAGDMSPTVVASGMKVALLTTVFGLIAAIILQIFFNFIASKIESIVNDMEDASISFMDILAKYHK